MTIQENLQKEFSRAIAAAYPELQSLSVEVAPSSHADYQCNSAMRLGKQLKKSPREVAEAIIKCVDLPAKLEVAGPGFINIILDDNYLLENLNSAAPTLAPQKILVEFSSPNIAKEMHVGHLRSTIIGDAIARLFEHLGHEVTRLNHVGDWGTQFGMLIAYMKRHGKRGSDLTELVAFYKAAKQEFDSDPNFKKAAQLEVVALQGGDSDSLKAWAAICALSRHNFQQIYDLLGVELTERGESTYNPILAEIVAQFESAGLVTLDDGAKCIFLDGFTNRDGDPLPLIIQKSDGGYLYATTDLAAMRERAKIADRIIVVTDAGQATHFKMVEEASRKAGTLPSHVQFDHVTFGLVLGPDGKKFRTRSGETERLIDLLNRAVEKALALLLERDVSNPDELAQPLGIGAVKYADLSNSRTGDYTFSYDRMLQFEGNTAAFMLYAYVRILGIKRKVPDAATGPIEITHPSERALIVHLLRFSEALSSFARDLLPHRLAEYLYTLAEAFHAFHRDCRVQGSEHQASRLSLCDATAATLRTGLEILGLQVIDRM